MDQAERTLLVLHAGNRLVTEFEQRDVEDAVGDIDAALGVAGAGHAERLLEEFRVFSGSRTEMAM